MLIYGRNLLPQGPDNPVGMHGSPNAKDNHGYDREGQGDQDRFVAEGNPKEMLNPGDWKEQDGAEYE